MTSPPDPAPDRADPIDETVQSMVDIHDTHARDVGTVQIAANYVTNLLGRPAAVAVTAAAICLWVAGNLLAPLLGLRALERFPFPDLVLIATLCALLVTLLILTTQRHEQEVERKRDQLTLHMAVLSERKIAKVIALLEEQRRDDPMLPARKDSEAATMAQPADPCDSLDRIEGTTLSE